MSRTAEGGDEGAKGRATGICRARARAKFISARSSREPFALDHHHPTPSYHLPLQGWPARVTRDASWSLPCFLVSQPPRAPRGASSTTYARSTALLLLTRTPSPSWAVTHPTPPLLPPHFAVAPTPVARERGCFATDVVAMATTSAPRRASCLCPSHPPPRVVERRRMSVYHGDSRGSRTRAVLKAWMR